LPTDCNDSDSCTGDWCQGVVPYFTEFYCQHTCAHSCSRCCQVPAIHAWQESDSSVVETEIQVYNDGQFILAAKAWNPEGCVWEYEYALYNMNSDRSAKKFTVPLPAELTAQDITNIGFHDINYHSGEPYDATDWDDDVTSGSISWASQSYSPAANANALRWGTLYNFRFQAPREPNNSATIRIDLSKSGSPWSVTGTSIAPARGGACCTTGNVCSVSDECYCTTQSGAFKGVYTGCQDCNENDVPDACEDLDTGACCLSSNPNDCVMTATSACCEALDGQFWFGLTSKCETTDCSEGPMSPQPGP
jgi:hypothetical protein